MAQGRELPEDVLGDSSPVSEAIQILHFEAEWCDACKLLDRKIFSDPAVKKALAEGHIEFIRVDIDERPELGKQYEITRIPAEVVRTSRTREVLFTFRGMLDSLRVNGKCDPRLYVKYLNRFVPIASGIERLDEDESRITDSPVHYRDRNGSPIPYVIGDDGFPKSAKDGFPLPIIPADQLDGIEPALAGATLKAEANKRARDEKAHPTQGVTTNFRVLGVDEGTNDAMARAAEEARWDQAVMWFGKPIPDWQERAAVVFDAGAANASSGFTEMDFGGSQPANLRLRIRATPEMQIPVLRHEVNHTIFATYFNRATLRWFDEGAAVWVEGQEVYVPLICGHVDFITGEKRFRLGNLLNEMDYPQDRAEFLEFYAQSAALATFLLERRPPKNFIRLYEVAQKHGWQKAFAQVYGIESSKILESEYLKFTRKLCSPFGK